MTSRTKKPIFFLSAEIHSLALCCAVLLRGHLHAHPAVKLVPQGLFGWDHPDPLPLTRRDAFTLPARMCGPLLGAEVLSGVLSAEDRAGNTQASPVVNASLRNHPHKCESDFPRLYPLDFSQFLKKREALCLDKPEPSQSTWREHCWQWIPNASGGIK